MRISINLDVSSDLVPDVYGCVARCPLSYYDEHYDEFMCVIKGECPIKEALNETIDKSAGSSGSSINHDSYSLQDVPRYS